MLGALVIVFREAIEAGLIIGIVLAATAAWRRGAWVGLGIGLGVVGAGVIALFAKRSPMRSKALARSCQCERARRRCGLLMWHNAWMARHGREMAAEMATVGEAVTSGKRPMTALAVVVGGVARRRRGRAVPSASSRPARRRRRCCSAVRGPAAGAAFSALTYFGLLAIPARYIFTVTTVLIALLAAGMAAGRSSSMPPA
jgi:high-affinity iron transporter